MRHMLERASEGKWESVEVKPAVEAQYSVSQNKVLILSRIWRYLCIVDSRKGYVFTKDCGI